ncbi:ABC transporter substrate-binding protein [Candidatus Halobonum tyrrellensis]|uniref:Family 5 extracellular solute-binding protein n=1 Tax=Candidatus Halobonum tyrrellensis G22 TaxID=1324957 RepID=V4HHR1_9EURY|nr:ABC transporter substrate-binding protein [Candidatus Halobonum tyrrellensis]ESP87444.1 family 5 extracellular solute-binding protein [Candidatus Halobonum tyrrellensis G22]
MSERDPHVRRRRLLGAAGVGLAGTAGLAGYARTTGAAGSARARLATLDPPVTLDPVEAASVGSERAVEKLFDGLYAYDDGLGVVPRIADGPPRRPDATTAEVDLRADARFQNGRAVTPEDVAYSFEAPVAEDAPTKWRVDPVESVETVSASTVRVHLSHPYPALDHLLTHPVVPKAEREANPERFARDPVGSGPFAAASFTPEKKTVLDRWGEYWGETPPVDRLVFAAVGSPVTQMMGLATNRSDAIQPVSPLLAGRVADVTGASVRRRPGLRTVYFGFNCNEGPTTDPAVREAIRYCIDVDEAVEELVEPLGRRAYGLLPPQVAEAWGMPTEEWRETAVGQNAERARRLFREADATSGQLKILTPPNPKLKELGETLARGLRDAGRGALVTETGWERYLDRYVSGAERDYSVFVGSVAGTADPDSYLYPAVHENVEGLTNGLFYRDEGVMEAIAAARATTDRAERRRLYESALSTLADEHVYLPVCTFANSLAVDPDASALRLHPLAGRTPRLVGGEP